MIKTATGYHKSITEAIVASWNHEGKMDWLGLERVLRAILRGSNRIERNMTVRLIDEAIGAFTRRGREMGDERGPAKTVWVVCPRCNGSKLEPKDKKIVCEWCGGLGEVSAASAMASNDSIAKLEHPEYKNLLNKEVKWQIAELEGIVEAVYHSVPLGKDVARVRINESIAEIVDCDQLQEVMDTQ